MLMKAAGDMKLGDGVSTEEERINQAELDDLKD